MIQALLGAFGLIPLILPITAAIGLGVIRAVGVRLPEASVHHVVAVTFVLSFLATLGVDVLVLAQGAPTVVTLGQWMTLPAYLLEARLVFDLPGAVLMTLTALLAGLVGQFSAGYLHKDPGFRRFYILLLLFASGMMLIASADTLDLIFAGWEIVGLTSALLIAYFHEREAPVRHGLRAFSVYRICDVALLSAAVILHHELGEASLGAHVHLEPGMIASVVALLLVFATMGKAASFPFTGWLPRAMEGPTPSSAIFYGALSIHAGPFLLIRAWPLLEDEVWARVLMVVVGVLTAAHASMVGRVQTDAKSGLGYASAAQVGLIFVEIGLGFTELALVHLAGHALLRTWQLLRAPSIVQDQAQVVAAIGGARPQRGWIWERLLPLTLRRWGYRFALERWYLDDFGLDLVLRPLGVALRWLDSGDRAVADVLAGPVGRGEPVEEGR